MSATNRNGLKRSHKDFYSTPAWAIEAVAKEIKIPAGFQGCILDPGSGEGAISEYFAHRYPRAGVQGIELQPQLLARANALDLYNAHFQEGNYLNVTHWERPEYIVGNPPFSFAQQFITKALADVKEDGTVAMLLRIGFLAGIERHDFHTEHPCDVLVLSKRPSFLGGPTDATDYAWFLWGPGRKGRILFADVPEKNSKVDPKRRRVRKAKPAENVELAA